MSQSSHELMSSAIQFLQDPSTAQSSLANKIAFLESKGLTASQIQVALAQAAAAPVSSPYGQQQGSGQYYGSRLGNRVEFERDWRDWFIMSVVAGSAGFLALSLLKVSHFSVLG